MRRGLVAVTWASSFVVVVFDFFQVGSKTVRGRRVILRRGGGRYEIPTQKSKNDHTFLFRPFLSSASSKHGPWCIRYGSYDPGACADGDVICRFTFTWGGRADKEMVAEESGRQSGNLTCLSVERR